MKYPEYLQCALKHTKSCAFLFNSYVGDISKRHDDIPVFLELYYLLGYVVEGITVYSAYKLNNWPANQDIQYWPKSSSIINQLKTFTNQTGLDFYKERIINNNSAFSQGIVRYSVQGHNFQQIIHGLLSTDPTFNGFPYFGNGTIDPDVKDLIDNWRPDIRYYNPYNLKPNLANNLTEENVKSLLITCIDITTKAHQI